MRQPQMKLTGAWSSKSYIDLNFKIGNQDSIYSNSHQGDIFLVYKTYLVESNVTQGQLLELTASYYYWYQTALLNTLKSD